MHVANDLMGGVNARIIRGRTATYVSDVVLLGRRGRSGCSSAADVEVESWHAGVPGTFSTED